MSDQHRTKFVVAFYNHELTPGSKCLKQGYRHIITYQHLGRDKGNKHFEWIKEQRRGRHVDRSKAKLEHMDLPRYLAGLNPPGGVTVYEIEKRTPGRFAVWFPQPGGAGTAKHTLGITAWGIWTPWDLARYIQLSDSEGHSQAVASLKWEKIRRISIAAIATAALAFFVANNFVVPEFAGRVQAYISSTPTPKFKP